MSEELNLISLDDEIYFDSINGEKVLLEEIDTIELLHDMVKTESKFGKQEEKWNMGILEFHKGYVRGYQAAERKLQEKLGTGHKKALYDLLEKLDEEEAAFLFDFEFARLSKGGKA